MSVASKLITIAENLRAKLDAINVKLIAKGQTEAVNLNEVPAKIEAIETKKQDILNLVSGITKYTDSFEINGELRSNVLVQPSDFSDESTITWSSNANSYFSHSIENIEGSENGSVMVLNPVRTTETSVYNLFWFNSTVDTSTSEPRTYLIAVRAKASETITSYFPNMAITYYPTGSTGSRFLYFSYTPTTEWQTFYVIANIPENYYLKDITMCFCSRGITHYIDWIAAYDITGIDFDHMTFGANATATTSNVLSGKTFYKDGVCYTGTMTTATQATPNINVSSTGLITASATQSAGYVSSGTKEATKQLSTKSATTYTPNTNNQTISSGYYLTGTQTIKGDSNLVASNIKSGVSIFGVNGSYSGGASVVSDVVSPNSSGQLELYTGKTTAPNYIFLLKYPGNRVTESIKTYRALALWIDIVNDKRYMIQTQRSGMLISSMVSGVTSYDYSFSASSKILTITAELNLDDTINTSDFLVVALW